MFSWALTLPQGLSEPIPREPEIHRPLMKKALAFASIGRYPEYVYCNDFVNPAGAVNCPEGQPEKRRAVPPTRGCGLSLFFPMK
jgi:hypothetical protein